MTSIGEERICRMCSGRPNGLKENGPFVETDETSQKFSFHMKSATIWMVMDDALEH